jgi:hypothetical protein
MSAQERFNHVTGRKEFYIKPNNLPGYWTALGLCDRCYSYKKCLGLAGLSKEEWLECENSPLKLLATVEPTICCPNQT